MQGHHGESDTEALETAYIPALPARYDQTELELQATSHGEFLRILAAKSRVFLDFQL